MKKHPTTEGIAVATEQTGFDRLNRIVDGGHLAGLTGLEAKVLLVYLRHADNRSGRAFPAVGTIARRVGVKTLSRVRGAIRGLEQRGLLSLVTSGGGWKNTNIRQVSVPVQTGSKTDPVLPTQTGSEIDPPTGSKTDPRTGSKTDPQTTQGTTHGTTHTPTKAMGKAEGVCEELIQALGRRGFAAPKAQAVVQQHGAQRIRDVLRLARFKEEQGKLHSPLGFITHCLNNGFDLKELEQARDEDDQLLVPGDQWKGEPATLDELFDMGVLTQRQVDVCRLHDYFDQRRQATQGRLPRLSNDEYNAEQHDAGVVLASYGDDLEKAKRGTEAYLADPTPPAEARHRLRWMLANITAYGGTPPKPEVDDPNADGFTRFWREYPPDQRRDQDRCRLEWQRIGGDSLAEQILAGLRQWKQARPDTVPPPWGMLHFRLWRNPPGPQREPAQAA